MSGNEAVVPRQFVLDIKKLKTEQEDEYARLIKEDEEIWCAFYETPAFRACEKYIRGLVDALDELEGKALESGADLSEIGLRRLVNRLTKSNLMSLIRKVEQTAKTIHERRKKTTR